MPPTVLNCVAPHPARSLQKRDALKRLPRWTGMPIHSACITVRRSAFAWKSGRHVKSLSLRS
jgi:hypothetical protein